MFIGSGKSPLANTELKVIFSLITLRMMMMMVKIVSADIQTRNWIGTDKKLIGASLIQAHLQTKEFDLPCCNAYCP